MEALSCFPAERSESRDRSSPKLFSAKMGPGSRLRRVRDTQRWSAAPIHAVLAPTAKRGNLMNDIAAAAKESAGSAFGSEPRLDLQSHIADLEAKGLLVRIDHPVNKDTELHPLVRLQFIGGIPEAERRAFLFTHVTDATGKRYDMPVAVGAIAASAEIYALGMGREVGEIGKAWLDAINHPVAPQHVASAPCQEVVIDGEALRGPDG